MKFQTFLSISITVVSILRGSLAAKLADTELSRFDVNTGSNKSVTDSSDSSNTSVTEAMFQKTGDLTSLLKVYDVPSIRRAWKKEVGFLSTECKNDMDTFFTALDNSDLWALKVLDASGKHSTGFFWGNSYWTGSETLCNNVGLQRRHYTSNGNLPSEKKIFTDEYPAPIDLGFYKIKATLRLPRNVAPIRTILIGLCAPFSCRENDIRSLLNISLTNKNNPNESMVDILQIRTPHYIYRFWEDNVFWIIAGITSFVVVLLAVGTTYDIYRDRGRYKNVNQSRIPFTDYLGGERAKINSDNLQKEIAVVILPSVLRVTLFIVPIFIYMLQLENESINKFDSNPHDNTERSSVQSDSGLEIWQKILLSFSIRENMKTICYNGVSEDTIPTIHGLKAISMTWVILGHTCIVIFKYSDNMEFRTIIEKEFFSQTITNGAFSVDTFFFISGLLVSFLYFRTTAKIDFTRITGSVGIKSQILQFLGLICYRYGRLTAPYMFVLGCVLVSMKSFFYNSVFDPPTMDHDNCARYWWRNALYINTLFPMKEMCMLWSWYLADDTQFYILGSILLVVAFSHLKAASVLTIAFLCSSWATTAYVAYSNNHLPSHDDPLALFDKIYDKPWTRLGPYLIGMIVGWILFKTECKIKMNKITLFCGWLLTLVGMMSLVYGLYETKLDLITSAAYSSLSHTAWALGLSWIVIACSTGHGGIANKILSSTILYPFSRVTYCAYLIHPLVIRYMIINLDSPLHLNKEVVMFLFFGQVVVSYILSFIISLAFEAPVVSLLRILSPTKSNRNIIS